MHKVFQKNINIKKQIDRKIQQMKNAFYFLNITIVAKEDADC